MQNDERLVINVKLTKKETNQVQQIAERLHISIEQAAALVVKVAIKVTPPHDMDFQLMSSEATLQYLMNRKG